ncbi:Paf1 complex component [Phytophthora pseudosyringae]|uniref:Paf1 complex component n=1 Tax=Phytophthora pseudosyringae TaxID=221518 RepID=A0A8T1VUZ7_9STRA|nr:Paf1 complex component [Phytophthora pseudosyringae]
MASSPEAPSGSSSSSEDEFDLGGSSLNSGGDAPASSKSADPDKLFSDDSDEEEHDSKEGDDKTGVASPKKEEKDKEMEDLFGSDYDSEEEEFKASGVKESPARDGGRSNEDLFGDEAGDRSTSGGGGDGDNGYSDTMWLPKTPKAPKTAKYFMSKMPNILRLVPEPYTKEAIRAEMANPSDETLYRNYVRWRYQRDPASGRVLLDDTTKLPRRESNAKLVQWEDGTFSMFVGKEALTLSRQKLANSFLFVNEMASDSPRFQDSDDVVPGQESVLECHARLKEKFTIRPMTTASKSHKSLTMSMRAKHNKSVQKLKEYISELDGEREQEQRVKITDEKLRLQSRKKARQGYEYDRERSSRMDAQFLEEGYDAMDYDDDEHVGAIKEQFGKHKSSAALRKHGVRRPVPGGGFDEYRSSQRQRELEREREAERSESDNDARVDEGEDDEEEEEMVIHSHKKRRTVDEEDSE